MKIGYARVSTQDQVLHMQVDALKAAGCAKIYKDDGISAIGRKRPGLEKALKVLAAGDTLYVWSIDRAFRSTIHALNVLNDLRARGVQLRCITMNIDIETPEGRKWYRDAVSEAEYEHDRISRRTRDGMAAWKARGKKFGRPAKMTAKKIAKVRELHADGKISVANLAKRYRVSTRTIYRVLNDHNDEG